MIQVDLIDSTMVGAFRPTVEELLRGVQFSAPTLFTLDDLFVDFRLGNKQLWLFSEDGEVFLFAVSRLSSFPQGKMCTIGPIAGRRFKAALDFLPRFELWAKMQGVICLHCEVGQKLRKVLEKRNYVATGFAMYKSLVTYN